MAFVIGDVIDHGLSAVFSAEIRSILRAFLREHERPGLVLDQLNKYLCQSYRLFRAGLNEEGDKAPVRLAVAVLDAVSGKGSVALAGAEPPLLLGIEGDQDYQAQSFHLEQGDIFLMTTDGMTKARSGKDQLGGAGLRRLAEGAGRLETLDQKAQSILAGAREFGSGRFCADVCLVMARRQ